MFFTYVLYPFQANHYHKKWDIQPTSQIPVGLLGHELYTTTIKDINVLRKLERKSARVIYMSIARPQDTLDVAGLVEIIQAYFFNLSGQTVTCQVVANSENTLFYPIFEGQFIYAHEDEKVFFRDLTPFLGRSCLSVSWLGLEYQLRENNFFDVRLQEGILTYDSAMNFLVTREELLLRLTEVSSFVEERQENGFVSFPTDSLPGVLLLELAEIWQLKKKVTPDSISVVGVPYKETNEFPTLERDIPELIDFLEEVAQVKIKQDVIEDFTHWVKESLARLQFGQSPVYEDFLTLPRGKVKLVWQALIKANPLLASLQLKTLTFQEDAELWTGYVQFPILGPEDLRLLRDLLTGATLLDENDADGVFTAEVKPILEKPIMHILNGETFVKTEHGQLYKLPTERSPAKAASKNDSLETNPVVNKWRQGSYATPWGLYIYNKLGIYSPAFIK